MAYAGWHAASALEAGLRAIAGWPEVEGVYRATCGGANCQQIQSVGDVCKNVMGAEFHHTSTCPRVLWDGTRTVLKRDRYEWINPGRVYENERTPPRVHSPEWNEACALIAKTFADWVRGVGVPDEVARDVIATELAKDTERPRCIYPDCTSPSLGGSQCGEHGCRWCGRVVLADYEDERWCGDCVRPGTELRDMLDKIYEYREESEARMGEVMLKLYGAVVEAVRDTERPPSARTECYWCRAKVVDGRCTACEQRQP